MLRKANLEDALALSCVAKDIFRATFDAANSQENMDEYCRKYFNKKAQLRELINPDTTTFLIEIDSTIEGFIQLWWVGSPDCVSHAGMSAEIRRLYVSEKFQGRGLAQQLMQTAINEIVTRDYRAVWLGVWEHNTRAKAFYKKSGFSEVGEHDFYLGEELQKDIIMERVLNRHERTFVSSQ